MKRWTALIMSRYRVNHVMLHLLQAAEDGIKFGRSVSMFEQFD